jgi:acetamidase/formamidase
MEGARQAVRTTIDWLGTAQGLDPVDAYLLCSLAGDLKILEIVDAGVWNVGMLMPRSVFV